MRLSTWRPNVIPWLTDFLAIDTWFLENPDFEGERQGFLPPLDRFRVFQDSNNRFPTFEADQEIMLGVRIDSLPYSELPLDSLEGVWATTLLALFAKVKDWGVLGVSLVDNEEDPIAVKELSKSCWVVYLTWKIRIRGILEPETELDLGGVNQLLVGLWKTRLDGTSSVKVADISVLADNL